MHHLRTPVLRGAFSSPLLLFLFPRRDLRLNIILQKNVPIRSLIDMDIFSQILELDEDEETHDFSQPMVWEYFEQAEKTFCEMDDAVSAS